MNNLTKSRLNVFYINRPLCCSKKDAAVRRRELLDHVSKPLVQYLVKCSGEIVLNNATILLMVAVLTHAKCMSMLLHSCLIYPIFSNQVNPQLYDCFYANKLSLNVKKIFFAFLTMSTLNVNNSIKINNDIINQGGKNNKKESVKFRHTFNMDRTQTKSVPKYLEQFFAINKVKHFKLLYYTLIHNHITYCVQAWGNGNLLRTSMGQWKLTA